MSLNSIISEKEADNSLDLHIVTNTHYHSTSLTFQLGRQSSIARRSVKKREKGVR